MMANFESHVLVGHVGRDVELRYTPDGKAVADFSIAVNNPRRKDDPPTWYKVTCWQQTAEFANSYVKKGAAVLVSSNALVMDEWQDQDGNNRVTLVVTAQSVQLMDRPGERDETTAPQESEDMPF